MNKENSKILWKEMMIAGDFLKDKLPNHPNHPNGRNSYAHIALEIKIKFKMSYKEIPNDKLKLVLDYIAYLKNNPS